jgi:hypothetical protein
MATSVTVSDVGIIFKTIGFPDGCTEIVARHMDYVQKLVDDGKTVEEAARRALAIYLNGPDLNPVDARSRQSRLGRVVKKARKR